MIKILGQNYLSLDHFVDVQSFDAIVDDIILGIAKSRHVAGPTNTGPGYIDRSKKSIHQIYREILADTEHPYHKTITSLKGFEPFNFIQYKWPSHALGQHLALRSPGFGYYEFKSDETKCKDYPISANFTSLYSFIRSQNIFSSLGRIVIFLNETGTRTIEHRDYEDGISRKDEFIWICPLQNKKFYVRDDNEKEYLTSKFCYFDPANIHGTDPAETSAFSIRVDGLFSEEFKNKTGIIEHLK